MTNRAHIALIDDDPAVLDSLALYLTRHEVTTSCFSDAETFLATIDNASQFDCIVSDVRMPGASGLDLVRHFTKRALNRPIILITGHGDIDMAVSAIKIGAFDFIEKPFDEVRLLASIKKALEQNHRRMNDTAELEQLQTRFNSLSVRQRQVLELAAAGLSSKEIAIRLGISPKTVENYRAWVMEGLVRAILRSSFGRR